MYNYQVEAPCGTLCIDTWQVDNSACLVYRGPHPDYEPRGGGQDHHMTATAFNQKKFDELLLHIAELSADDETFGKTKLNKILYYADFLAYGTSGESITGATYQRRPFGPVPKEIAGARQRLQSQQRVQLEQFSYFGRQQERMTPLQGADLTVFTRDELALVTRVVKMLRDLNGSEVSDLSHQELGWRLADDGETIPYDTVFLNPVQLTSENIRRGREIDAELTGASVAA